MPTEASRALYERALRSIPTGTHSNSRVGRPHPTYFERARGASLWDVDGHGWTDFVMGNGAVILGHGDPAVTAAVQEALANGLGAGFESELSVTAAERFLELVPSADQVRFTNTGTEAVMHAVHVARAATGRPGIAKVEGAYHGWWDEVFVSAWPDPNAAGDARAPQPLAGGGGLRAEAVAAAVVVPFNDIEATAALLTEHRDRVAALLVEPTMIDIGYVEPEPGYLEGLRELTRSLGIVLVFDELLTGFRVAVGGAQQRYGVTPDLSTWGKALANGFPVAAVAGTREMMALTEPGPDAAPFVGTFNGYRPALAACVATLERLADGAVTSALERRSAELVRAWNALATEAGVAAVLHAGGGHFQPYFTSERVVDYRTAATTRADAYERWRRTLAERRLLVPPKALLHGAFSAAHGDLDIESLLDATRSAFARETRHA